MKKSEYRAEVEDLRRMNGKLLSELADLQREAEQMRKHWQPIPMMHPWTPRNAQCTLCDEPRDAPRHQVDS